MLDRQIKPIREEIDFNILAVVPNRLSDRIDQQTEDRNLIEELNQELGEYVPPFARITSEEFEKIDAGEMQAPKPGIRDRKAVTKAYGEGQPLSAYDPNNDQLQHLDTLARIVEEGSTDV
jgi:chromosome partitioning protein